MTRIVLRPSGAVRWGPGACPGSPVMEARYPEDTESEKARQGTAAHYYVTEGVQGRTVAVGTLAPNGYPIDQEMLDGGQEFIADVQAEVRQAGPNHLFRVETMVTMHGLVHPDNEGTPDAFLVDHVNKRLIVWDYKYGHRSVDAFRNWQVVDYAAGVLEGCEYTLADVADWSVSLRIVQPRDYGAAPVKRWDITGAQLFVHIEQLALAAAAAATPGAPTISGPHCRDCDARHACPALRLAGGLAVDFAHESVPHELDNEGVGLWLRTIAAAKKRLEALETGLQEVAIAKMQSGQAVPHWQMGRGDTREKWKVPAADVFLLGTAYGVDLRKPQEPITPAQARKAGVDASVIATYAEKPAGAVKLMPADASNAAKAFS